VLSGVFHASVQNNWHYCCRMQAHSAVSCARVPTARTSSIVAGVTMALTVVSARAWMEQLVDPLSMVQLSLLPTKHVLPLAGTSPTVRVSQLLLVIHCQMIRILR
jgi:hypothetical protein